MLTQFTKTWRMIAFRGVLAIIWGAMTLVWPGISLTVLVLLFGAYALIDGIGTIATAVQSSDSPRGWPLLHGIAGILAGIMTMLWPGITALGLVYFIAAWALVTGLLQIFAAIELRKEITHEWIPILSGALSVLFGILVAISPATGALSIVWIIGIYAIISGVLFVSLALHLRSLAIRPNFMDRAMAA